MSTEQIAELRRLEAAAREAKEAFRADHTSWELGGKYAAAMTAYQAALRNAAPALFAAAEENVRLRANRCPECGLGPMKPTADSQARYCQNCIHEAAADAEAAGLNEWMAVAKEYETECERLRAGLEVIRDTLFGHAHTWIARSILTGADLRDPAVLAAVAAGTWTPTEAEGDGVSNRAR